MINKIKNFITKLKCDHQLIKIASYPIKHKVANNHYQFYVVSKFKCKKCNEIVFKKQYTHSTKLGCHCYEDYYKE